MSGATAGPGEILVAFDAVELALREYPGSAGAATYAALRALGVVRVDSRGQAFPIDLDMITEQGDRSRAEILAVERRWHAGDYPGGRRVR
jgi:hypothetical protein